MRVYELSKQLEISNKDAVDALRHAGFDVASHMSMLPQEAIDFLTNQLNKKTSSNVIEAPSSNSISQVAPQASLGESHKKHNPEAIIVQKEENVIVAEPMLLGDFAQKVKKPITEVIVALLKKGTPYAKNQVLPAVVVEQLAKSYNFEVRSPKKELEEHHKISLKNESGSERPPVIVVIGHVDHGKTTLLDYIRKTRVAAKEKGGITQHLGAYEVTTSHGNIIFLDTPGHEAFIKMRSRGVRVADIAILVVAADDGVKPQTIEAIKQAAGVQVPVIVALNKIDKATPAQIEAAKRGLNQYGLIPEEWGGQTIIVPLSAKTGEGVDQLLEFIALQSQLMELKANAQTTAKGFVLEAKIEKGFGPVATVICQEGTLQVGDYFIAGAAVGRISSLTNSQGARIKEAGPVVPVRISGFDFLPDAGDFFKVVSLEEYKRARNQERSQSSMEQKYNNDQPSVVRVIVKADNNSSKEAIIEAIEKLSKGTQIHPIQIITAAVGDVNESDVDLAANTNSIIYSFHVKADTKATLQAQRSNVSIRFYHIIYQLLDDLSLLAKKAPEISYTKTKIGEATVLCTFKVKSMGVVAGAKIIEGKFAKEGRVIVKRGRYKVGEGSIKSLERDKKAVKEVHTGFECAFFVEGFENWQVDDRVECWLEIPSTN